MPNRIIKESICYSDDIDKLTWFEEVVFYRLLVRCDDNGRLDARAPFLRSMLFATRPDITERCVDEAVGTLAQAGLVELYEAGGRPYLTIRKWGLHQRIRNVRGKYPPPSGEGPPRPAANRGEAPPESQSQSESQSRSEAESATRAHFAPPTAQEVRAYCLARKNAVDAGRFVDFYAAKGWRIGREPMRDWRAAVRTWEGAGGGRRAESSGEADRRAREDMERMRAFLEDKRKEESGHEP